MFVIITLVEQGNHFLQFFQRPENNLCLFALDDFFEVIPAVAAEK